MSIFRKDDKKKTKAKAKIQKKELKAKAKGNIVQPKSKVSTKAIQFAEAIKGIIYIVLAVSLIIAIVLGQTGVIITLEDIIASLMVAQIGKVVLLIIAVALLIYGSKKIGVIK